MQSHLGFARPRTGHLMDALTRACAALPAAIIASPANARCGQRAAIKRGFAQLERASQPRRLALAPAPAAAPAKAAH